MPGNPTLSLTPKTPPVLLMIVNDSIRPKRGKVKSEGEKQQKERGRKPTEPEADGGASQSLFIEQYFSRLGDREAEQTTHYGFTAISNQMTHTLPPALSLSPPGESAVFELRTDGQGAGTVLQLISIRICRTHGSSSAPSSTSLAPMSTGTGRRFAFLTHICTDA